MQLLGTADALEMVTDVTADVDVVCDFFDATAADPPAPKGSTSGNKLTNFTTAATKTVCSAPAAATLRKIRQLTAFNKHATATVTVTVNWNSGGTLYRMQKVTLRPGELLEYHEGKGWLPTYLPSSPALRTVVLGADHTNATTTPTEVTGLSITTGVGKYRVIDWILYQSSATTAGFKASVNHTGTVSSFVSNLRFAGVTTTASAADAGQAVNAAAAGIHNSFSQRAKSTAGLAAASVDVANADMLLVIETLLIVTVDGDYELWMGAEAAGTITTKAGTSREILYLGA